MITRIRLFVLIARPSLVVIFCLFAAVGVAQGGAPQDPARLVSCLVPVIGFVVFSVVVNDIADRAIDEINLPGNRRRPLVAGTTTDRDFQVLGATGAVVAIVGSALLGVTALGLMIGGLCLSASYSLRPVRLADRGAIASLLLPAGYVAVPYFLGVLSVRTAIGISDLAVGGAIYLGFIGRILLKDFRDVRGDALLGKRTFLVRHGRRWTCVFSAGCWIAGSLVVVTVRQTDLVLAAAYWCQVGFALLLLIRLAIETSARRDEWLISALAILGRGLVLTLLVHYAVVDARWPRSTSALLIVAIAVLAVGQASVIANHGPARRRSTCVESEVRDLLTSAVVR